MPTVLSTKKLKEHQRSLLVNAGVSLVEYEAIKIEFLPFEIPSKIENAIFTSRNAVLAIQHSEAKIQHCYCVGEKTKSLLEEKGFNVVKMTEYASELADFIVKNHKNHFFHFFCGTIRRDEIPSKLNGNNIAFEEIEVYKTSLNTKKFERQFDAILFFSPSGVRNFITKNNLKNSKVICIGTTTASEAKKYAENVVIANATTVESVIAKVVKEIKKI